MYIHDVAVNLSDMSDPIPDDKCPDYNTEIFIITTDDGCIDSKS